MHDFTSWIHLLHVLHHNLLTLLLSKLDLAVFPTVMALWPFVSLMLWTSCDGDCLSFVGGAFAGTDAPVPLWRQSCICPTNEWNTPARPVFNLAMVRWSPPIRRHVSLSKFNDAEVWSTMLWASPAQAKVSFYQLEAYAICRWYSWPSWSLVCRSYGWSGGVKGWTTKSKYSITEILI